MNDRSEIDGLRALAVVPVILFHPESIGFPVDWLGVYSFFVIGGYLNTRITLEDLMQGKCSITAFYERRSRRILPT